MSPSSESIRRSKEMASLVVGFHPMFGEFFFSFLMLNILIMTIHSVLVLIFQDDETMNTKKANINIF